jgi:hypothetical protein
VTRSGYGREAIQGLAPAARQLRQESKGHFRMCFRDTLDLLDANA